MLHFNYSLDNELTVAPDRLPSGIQTQAFEMALNRMGQRFRSTVQMIGAPVATLDGKRPIDGMSPGWQERIKTEAAFLGALPAQLMTRARVVALAHGGNAVGQGALERNWNRWVEATLKTYGEALGVFQQEVTRGMSNGSKNGLPPVLSKLAAIAKVAPPMLPSVKATNKGGMAFFDTSHTLGQIDPDYLGETNMPLVFGALAGMSLVGLAAWYFSRQPQPPLGYY